MNNLALAGCMVTAPSAAFVELRERPRFWFPLLLVVLSTAVMVYWYYSTVDFEWLKDQMFGNNPKFQQMAEAERAQAMGMIGRNTMLWGSVVGTLIAVPIVYVLSALYFLLAAKVTKLPQGFTHWFALTCWTALPVLLSIVVAAIFLLISDTNQMPPGVLQPLSLNELVFHLPMGAPGQQLLESFAIPSILSWILAIIGVHVWSQRSWMFSTILVLIPGILIYGIWAFFAFR